MASGKLWALVLAFAALHVAMALALPLVEDEAYYQMWASVPSAGYYDHPPMIAWSIAAGQMVFGNSLLGVRAGSILASALVTLLTFRIGFLLSNSQKTALRAALWGSVMIPIAWAGFAATPDAGSVLFWTAAIWALSEIYANGRAEWWLLAGLFAGLGVLSKFTDLFFGLALVVWLFTTKDGRAWLPHWQVWAGAAIGMLVLVPFAVWNFQHDWVGFQRQFGRIDDTSPFSLVRFLVFWLSIVVLVTPLIFWQVLRGGVSGRVPRFLWWICAPVVLYLTYHATKASAGGQWLVPIFPTLAIIAALAAKDGWVTRWSAPAALVLGMGLTLIGFWPGQVLIPGHNPFNQGRGWPRVIEQIRQQARASGAGWIATDAYGLTGQLTHYLGTTVPVWSMTQPERYLYRAGFSQSLCAQKALFVSRTNFSGRIPYFEVSAPGPDITRKQGAEILMQYHIATVSGPRGAVGEICRK